MPDVSFSGLVIVAAVAFLSPLLLGLAPRLRLPSVVVEIVVGIVIGPSVLGWVEPDLVIRITAVLGLAFLLFLAGLEIELERFRGRFLRISLLGLALSFAISLVVAFGLSALGLFETPLIVAIILLATSLGLVAPVLKDANETGSGFGQLVVASASIADFAAVILLSLFFSREATGAGVKLLLLGGFIALLAVAGFVVARAGKSRRLSDELLRLQDTTAEIRVRGAVLFLLGIVALAEAFGLEVVLGAFMAGAILAAVDRDAMMSHPNFRLKLEAIGFGFLVPVFFITSGLTFDLDALLAGGDALVQLPVFVVALLVIRGIPAVLYKGEIGPRAAAAASLLQATSLPFIVAATQIGMELGVLTQSTGAALVAAGLLSVLIFPLAALSVLRGGEPKRDPSRSTVVDVRDRSAKIEG